ncbi:YggS family pyridoxal phosphate-dependent enzyme [Candidatus Woesearchaeota archaeon]|nr:YggS family pyridoxal phosphate-dependent enzyme [Candidatus Woesearchaeota archaeon]
MDIPKNVRILAAAKGRSAEDVQRVIDSGIKIIGENYVQEAKQKKPRLRGKFEYHFIGHLQKNKVGEALKLFDLIQAVDSLELAKEISTKSKTIYPVLIEINSAKEESKTGVSPEYAVELIRKISKLPNIKIKGLMTMGPKGNPGIAFRETKNLFDKIKTLKINNVDMEILSMGMSDSYKIAIEEGATMVRLGRVLFESM